MSDTGSEGSPPRVSELQPFLAMEVMERAFELEREGRDILHLEIGEPDGEPPEAASEACARALAAGETRYTDSRGLIELREAIAGDLARRFGVEVEPARILVTSGTSPALLMAFAWLLEGGGEVLIPTPHYPCYPNFVRFCGGEPVFVPTQAEEGFVLRPEDLERAVTRKTRALVIGSPANPTGAITPRATLLAAKSAGLQLVSDEIYDGLVYGTAQVTSALEIDSEAFVLDGFSKRYAMTGFRLGWIVAPQRAVRSLQIMQQNFFISANRFVQHAGRAALEHGASDVTARANRYAERRDRLVAGLRSLGFGIDVAPGGAFYVLADARRFGTDSKRLAFEILERAGVGLAPGIDFGEAAEGHLRFCFAVGDDVIDAALDRLDPVLHSLASGQGSGSPLASRVSP